MHKRFSPKRIELLPAAEHDGKGKVIGYGKPVPTAVITPKGA